MVILASQKVEIEALPDGLTKTDGNSIEEILEILRAKGVWRILCYPYMRRGEFRRHEVILTRSDYEMLAEDGCFGEITNDGPALSSVGLHVLARYQADSFDTLRMHRIKEAFPVERTQLRKCQPAHSPYDGDFLELNQLRLADAMNPYRQMQ